MAHSLQLGSSDTEHVSNPWNLRTNDQDPPHLTTTSRQRGDTDFNAVVWQDHDMILSPSPPPQSGHPIHAQPPMQTTDTTPADPRIASLKAIFPDFDDAVMSVHPRIYLPVSCIAQRFIQPFRARIDEQ